MKINDVSVPLDILYIRFDIWFALHMVHILALINKLPYDVCKPKQRFNVICNSCSCTEHKSVTI